MSALLPYARDNWLYHTALFTESVVDMPTLELCNKSILGKTSTITLPWTSAGRCNLSPNFLDYAVQNQHRMLVSHVFRNMGLHDHFDYQDQHLQDLELFLERLPDRGTTDYGRDFCFFVALQAAVEASRQTLVDLLLRKIGIDFPYYGHSINPLLEEAVRSRNILITQLSIDNGALINAILESTGRHTALHHAVSLGEDSEPFTRLLLDNGADPNVVSKNWVDDTILRAAVSSDAPESVLLLLLKHDARVNYPAGHDQYHSVLDHAIEKRNWETQLELLLKYCDNINAFTVSWGIIEASDYLNFGKSSTILFRAVIKDAPLSTMKLLLKTRADPNVRIGKHRDRTILTEALLRDRHVALIYLLLKYGANPNTPGIEWQTPLEIARGNSDGEGAVELLKTFGAQEK